MVLGPDSCICRSVAVLALPIVMSACLTWQPQDVANLRDVIRRDEPEEIRLRTRISDDEVELVWPRISGDSIAGLHRSRALAVDLADVAEARIEKTDVLLTTLAVLGVLGVAAVGKILEIRGMRTF